MDCGTVLAQQEAEERAARFERNRQVVEQKLSRTPTLLAPQGGVYYTGNLHGDDTRLDAERDVAYGLHGSPAIPDRESELSRWVVLNVKPAASVNGLWVANDGPSVGKFFEGELRVIITDRALRGSSNDGKVEQYRTLDARWVCFAFVLPLERIDWIMSGKRAVAFGCDDPFTIIAAKAYERADSTWDYNVRLFRNENALFATDLALAAARAQSDHPDAPRRQRATEILQGGADALRFDRRGRPPEVRFDR
jgi:hypothetical protein